MSLAIVKFFLLLLGSVGADVNEPSVGPWTDSSEPSDGPWVEQSEQPMHADESNADETTMDPWIGSSEPSDGPWVEQSEPSDGPSVDPEGIQIMFAAKLDVSDPEAFVADPAAKEGVIKGLADMLGIDASYVDAVLSLVDGRRLKAAARKLSAKMVQVDYTISVPKEQSPSTMRDAIGSKGATRLSTSIQSGVTASTAGSYTVEVTSVTAATILQPAGSNSSSSATMPTSTDLHVANFGMRQSIGVVSAWAVVLACW